MNWFVQLLTSSIGKKLIMSLTGLFLCLFLIVHLAGNLQLLLDDGGAAFNAYTYKMTHSIPIKIISYGTYFFILLHAVQGIALAIQNRSAKGSQYAVKTNANQSSWASSRMGLLGILIFAFLLIHMGDFWWKMKFGGNLGTDEAGYMDLYSRVEAAFNVYWIVIVYVIGQLILSFHLWHGFQSAFQTLGINHPKYTPAIKFLGKVFAILIPAGFAFIPIYHYFVL